MSKPASTLGTLDALPVGLLSLGIGLSLGGPTVMLSILQEIWDHVLHILFYQ
jgi:glycerol uptake facilitator protein